MPKDPRPADKFRVEVIAAHKAKAAPLRKDWGKAGRAYRSQFWKEEAKPLPEGVGDDTLVIEANWLFGFTETLVANICPTNPQVTINHRRPELEDAAKYRQALVNDFYIRDKTYQKVWKGAGRGVIYPRVFFKMVWSKTRERPTARVLNPEYIFFDDTAEEWEDIRYLVEVVPMTKAELQKRVGKKGKQGTNYRASLDIDRLTGGAYPGWLREGSRATDDHDIAAENFEWFVVYEFYDFVEDKLFHYLDGDPLPLFEGELPYYYLRNNFHMLTYNDNLQDIGGLSDAQIVMPALEALNEVLTLQLWHNQASVPRPVVNESLLDDPDDFWTAMQEADGPNKGIGLRTQKPVSIDQVLGHTPTPSLPINWESTKADLRELIEFSLAIASYQRGGLGQSDVATELALSDTALRTRNARRQKAIYAVLEWMAEAVIALYMQYMPDDAELPLRLGIDSEVHLVGRESMGMGPQLREGDERLGEDGRPRMPDPFSYDYVARPYNAQEQNSIAQLKMLTNYAELLVNSPDVDPRKLTLWLLELIHAEHIAQDPEKAEQIRQAMMGGPPPGQSQQSPEGADTGGQGIPADAQALLQGGVVEGAQRVPGGLEGGPQAAM